MKLIQDKQSWDKWKKRYYNSYDYVIMTKRGPTSYPCYVIVDDQMHFPQNYVYFTFVYVKHAQKLLDIALNLEELLTVRQRHEIRKRNSGNEDVEALLADGDILRVWNGRLSKENKDMYMELHQYKEHKYKNLGQLRHGC